MTLFVFSAILFVVVFDLGGDYQPVSNLDFEGGQWIELEVNGFANYDSIIGEIAEPLVFRQALSKRLFLPEKSSRKEVDDGACVRNHKICVRRKVPP